MPPHGDHVVVVFRKWKDSGEVIALFPGVQADHEGQCLAYTLRAHHVGVRYHDCLTRTVPATPADYAGLHAALRDRGHALIVRRRKPPTANP